jgi:hypothetical protein
MNKNSLDKSVYNNVADNIINVVDGVNWTQIKYQSNLNPILYSTESVGLFDSIFTTLERKCNKIDV